MTNMTISEIVSVAGRDEQPYNVGPTSLIIQTKLTTRSKSPIKNVIKNADVRSKSRIMSGRRVEKRPESVDEGLRVQD